MYSFLFDPTYMTLIVMALLIFLVLFLWRKLTILEGNFYILEKRVNLMKKESRENKIAKSIERSNIVMNEIFGDACKSAGDLGGCVFPVASTDEAQPDTNNTMQMDDENVKITFTNDLDLDKKIEEVMDPVDIINALDMNTTKDADTVSIASDITFNTDEKYSQKKLSKMNLDRLKDVCTQLNLNSDGTKAQLITRILENNK
jgi:hypothetical protein